jgi:hypothetical protein
VITKFGGERGFTLGAGDALVFGRNGAAGDKSESGQCDDLLHTSSIMAFNAQRPAEGARS